MGVSFLDAAAFATKEVRDGDQCWVDAVEAGRILATPCAIEEAKGRIAARNAELIEHGYAV
jgi:hypothetical protein